MAEEVVVEPMHLGIWRKWSWGRVRKYIRLGQWEQLVRPMRRVVRHTPVGPYIDVPPPEYSRDKVSFDVSGVSLNSVDYGGHTLVGAMVFCDGAMFMELPLSVPVFLSRGDSLRLTDLSVTFS